MIWMTAIALAGTGLSESAAFRGDSDGSCGEDFLLTTLPEPEDVDVPVDLVPTLFLVDCEGASTPYTVRVRDEAGDLTVASTTITGTAGVFSYAELLVELDADSEYTWVVTSGDGQETFVGFHTGSEGHTPVSEGPTWVETLWDPDGTVRIQVEGTQSPHGVTFLEARDGDEVVATGILDGPRATMRPDGELDTAGEQCLTLFQRDVDASWVQGADFCHTSPGRCGCASQRAPLGLAPLLLVGLLARRRR